jgi:Domain of unknown function (DUF4349)/PKD domain
MKKRWIIIIIVVLLIASFTIYKFFNSGSIKTNAMIAQQLPSAGNEEAERGTMEHALGLDVPFYTRIFSNLTVPAPQNYPVTNNSISNTNNTFPTTTPVLPSAGSISDQPMIVRTADLSMAVTDIGAAVAQITRLADDNNGFVVSADQTSTDQSISGVISIRIPAAQFENAMSTLQAMAVKVTSENVSASDVTQEFTDLNSTLNNLQATEAQLLEIMQKAVTVDDILAVQTQLTNTAGQIETTKGRMQYLEQTSAMSLITVNLQQSTLTISLYAGTTYARTKDNIGFAVDIQGGISPFSYQWDFGDAAKSVEAAPWHKYNASGNYTVNVIVTDDKGNKAVDRRSNYITILPGWSPHDILDGAWRGLLSFLRFLFAAIVWILLFSPAIIVVALVWYFTRRSLKRRKAKTV